jgi:hypothetical protein
MLMPHDTSRPVVMLQLYTCGIPSTITAIIRASLCIGSMGPGGCSSPGIPPIREWWFLRLLRPGNSTPASSSSASSASTLRREYRRRVEWHPYGPSLARVRVL